MPLAFVFLLFLPFLHGDEEALQFKAKEAKRTLAEKILPYWFDTAQDGKRGGYLLSDDAALGRSRAGEKQLVSQSRMVWGFSKAHLAGYSTIQRNYLNGAKQGYEFLQSYFIDPVYGGCFWSVDLKGKVQNDAKFLYGQAFAIYAFVEFFRASGDEMALQSALDIYRAVQRGLHDEMNGGWIEQTDRLWNRLARGDRRIQFERVECKSANAHLHWMEALAELYDASKDPNVRASLIEALQINKSYFFPENPCLYTACRLFDWSLIDGEIHAELPYGHNVEFAWLMIRAEEVLGEEPSWDRFFKLVNHTLEYGFDHERGGAYLYGAGNNPAYNTKKVWWVQAELMAALCLGLRKKPNKEYEQALKQLWDFTDLYMSCRDGIWISSVSAEGAPMETTKAGSWKANYHDLRAWLLFIDTYTAPSRSSAKIACGSPLSVRVGPFGSSFWGAGLPRLCGEFFAPPPILLGSSFWSAGLPP